MNNLIVGIGETLWDMLPDGKKLGGAPANFAYHVSQFGLQSCVVSAVGNDSLGNEIIESLNAKGMNYLIPDVPYPTGTVEIEVDCLGIPQYDIKENVAWDNIPYNDRLESVAAKTKAICFGSLAQRNAVSRGTIHKFINAMPKENDTLVVCDINLRQQFYDTDTLCDSLNLCNILKINDEELEIISKLFKLPENDINGQCRALMERYNLKMIILTCGINGSYLFTSDDVSFQPTPKVGVADTVGAGDSFTAAFIASILKGKSVQEAHSLAVRTSAYVCTQKGAMPTLPEEYTKA
jgi:hypothetical protein BACCOPRO_02542